MKNAVVYLISFILCLSLFHKEAKAQSDTSSVLSKAKTTVVETTTAVVSSVKTGIHAVDTSSNFKMMYTDLKNGVAAIASSLKIGAEHVYEVLVRQQVVTSITYLICYGFLIFVVLLGYSLRKKSKSVEFEYSSPDFYEAIHYILMVLAGLVFVVMFAFTIKNTVMGFVNPEYGAIEKVVEITKELAK